MLTPLYHQGSVTPSKDVVCDYLVSAILPSLTSASTSASTSSTLKVGEVVSRGTINAHSGSITVNVLNEKVEPTAVSAIAVQGVLVFYNRMFPASKYLVASVTSSSSVVLSFKVPSVIVDSHGTGPYPFYFSLHLEYKGNNTKSLPLPISPLANIQDIPDIPVAYKTTPVTTVTVPNSKNTNNAPLPPIKNVPTIKKRKTNHLQGRFGNSYNYSHAVAMALDSDKERQRHF